MGQLFATAYRHVVYVTQKLSGQTGFWLIWFSHCLVKRYIMNCGAVSDATENLLWQQPDNVSFTRLLMLMGCRGSWRFTFYPKQPVPIIEPFIATNHIHRVICDVKHRLFRIRTRSIAFSSLNVKLSRGEMMRLRQRCQLVQTQLIKLRTMGLQLFDM